MPILNFKPRPTPGDIVFSGEPYYDLFDGGYIKPENILQAEDAKRVNDAVALISLFLAEANDEQHICLDS